MTEQTDLITGHPFQPHPLEPEVCGVDVHGWACGYAEEDHEDRWRP